MRWWILVFVGLPVVLAAALVAVVRMHDDDVIVLKKPPASLAKWYKPENKRQVWLHTMFKLRREMQAVEAYATSKDPENLTKWTEQLVADYGKIATMVPEWAARTDPDAVARLRRAAQETRYGDTLTALRAVKESCRSCHADFRAVTATLYRAPDFAALKVNGTPYAEHMAALNRHVNDIKIAYTDGRDGDALGAFADLKTGMATLGDTCVGCHDKLGRKAYPDAAVSVAMDTLDGALQSGDIKAKGRALGTVAVLACAQCHGTHRLAFDAKTLFARENDWRALLRHRF